MRGCFTWMHVYVSGVCSAGGTQKGASEGGRGSFGSVSGEKGQGIGRSSVERQRALGKDKRFQKKKSRGRREEWLGKHG